MTLVLPTPFEPLVDKDGKINEVWYRYLSESATALNTITTASTVSLAYSTQTDQEAGTSTVAIVTPSVQQYHPSAAKAWGFIDDAETTSPVLVASYNAASVSVSSVDFVITVTLDTPFSSTAYTVDATPRAASLSVGDTQIVVLEGQTSNAFSIESTGFTAMSFVCYGDQ